MRAVLNRSTLKMPMYTAAGTKRTSQSGRQGASWQSSSCCCRGESPESRRKHATITSHLDSALTFAGIITRLLLRSPLAAAA